jgi:bisphosphoglycerate-dependent phosphoglycerate mutase
MKKPVLRQKARTNIRVSIQVELVTFNENDYNEISGKRSEFSLDIPQSTLNHINWSGVVQDRATEAAKFLNDEIEKYNSWVRSFDTIPQEVLAVALDKINNFSWQQKREDPDEVIDLGNHWELVLSFYRSSILRSTLEGRTLEYNFAYQR